MVLSLEEERKNFGLLYEHQTHKSPLNAQRAFCCYDISIIDLPMGLHYPYAPNPSLSLYHPV